MAVHDGDSFNTLAVHGGERRPGPQGSVVYPIFQSTVYTVEPGTDYHDLKYLRLNSTPSQQYLNDKVAVLEGAEAAVTTASGMAAATSTLHSVLKAGDHLLVGDVLYGGTHEFLTEHAEANGWSFTFVDPHDPQSWAVALTPATKAFMVESITNPLMRVAEHTQVIEFARQHNIVSIIDNTFATPVNFRPVKLGFDIAFHSATKYLNGHSDLVAGCVVGSSAHVNAVRKIVNHYGGALDAHASFLLARGLKTLALRVKAQNHNAMTLAQELASHQKVAAVNYPGLADHPDHQLAAELFNGFGGMLSLRPVGGVSAAHKLTESVRLPFSAPSLGGVESLITRPAISSHAGMDPQTRHEIGISDDLVRVSCGIEDTDDLIADFRQALDSL